MLVVVSCDLPLSGLFLPWLRTRSVDQAEGSPSPPGRHVVVGWGDDRRAFSLETEASSSLVAIAMGRCRSRGMQHSPGLVGDGCLREMVQVATSSG